MPNNTQLHEIEGYTFYHTIRSADPLDGGISIYINSNIPRTQLYDHSICNNNIEICTVRIIIDNTPFTIASIYRLHYKYHNVNELNTIIDTLLSQSDLNINLLEHETHTPTNNFLSTMQSFIFHTYPGQPDFPMKTL